MIGVIVTPLGNGMFTVDVIHLFPPRPVDVAVAVEDPDEEVSSLAELAVVDEASVGLVQVASAPKKLKLVGDEESVVVNCQFDVSDQVELDPPSLSTSVDCAFQTVGVELQMPTSACQAGVVAVFQMVWALQSVVGVHKPLFTMLVAWTQAFVASTHALLVSASRTA